MSGIARRQILKAGLLLGASLSRLTACVADAGRQPASRGSSDRRAGGAATPTLGPTTAASHSAGRAAQRLPATSPGTPSPASSGADTTTHLLLVTNAAARHVSFVDPAVGGVARVEVGAAPWGLALAGGPARLRRHRGGRRVAEAARRQRLALVPYRAAVGPPQVGEYRPVGMGIAAAPDGRHVYVGVYRPNGPSRLEVLDTERLAVVATVPVGARPFQVLVGRDGREV